MATKTAPAPEPPNDGLTDAYARARAELDTARRRHDADEPIIENVEEDRGDHIAVFRRIHPSRVAAAQAHVRDAERALRNTHGQAAVDLADAVALHADAQAALDRAEQTPTSGAEMARLIAAEEVATRHVKATEKAVARANEAYARRCGLEERYDDILKTITNTLEGARSTLADKAAAAEQALLDLVAAADSYKDVQQDVTARLVTLGFTDGQQHDGSPHDTVPGAVLRVAGRDWIRVDASELMMRSVLRVAEAIGVRPLRDRLLPLAGGRRYAADALLSAGDLELVDRQQPARVTRLSLHDAMGPVEVVRAQHGGFHRDPPAKKRRISFKSPAA